MRKVVLVVCYFLIFLSPQAKAASFMDALVIVGAGTVVGGVMGASTLPFYSEPSENTGNIWTGAALGAVLGVAIAAYSAVSNTDDIDFEEDEPGKDDLEGYSTHNLYLKDRKQDSINRNQASLNLKQAQQVAFWSPLQQYHF